MPRTRGLAAAGLATDEAGYILTGADVSGSPGALDQWSLSRAPLPLEANCPGFFAAGDVRSGSIKRVASAVGEGAMAVRLVHEHLAQVG